MRPSGLANPCTRCGELMPFDPQAQNQLCNKCNRLLALGGDFSTGSEENSSDSENHQYQNNSSSASLKPTMSPQALYNTYFSSSSAFSSPPTITPPTYQSTDYSASAQPMVDSPSLKRKHHQASNEEQYPSKRSFGNAYAPHTPSTLRQNVWPPTFDPGETVAVTTETEDEDEPEFVDAQEDQGLGLEGGVAMEDEGGEEDAEGGVDDNEDEVPPQQAAAVQEAGDDEVQEQVAVDEDDLFTQTFGRSGNRVSGEANANANESDNEDAPTEEAKDFDRSDFITSLQTNGPSTTNPTQTKKKPRKPTLPHPTGFLPPSIPQHVARNLRKQHSFHTTALQHLPRLHLASTRYWIGVLKIGVPPRATTQSEKNFTWMKGNRLTTVETIWEAYCLGSAAEEKEGVVLLVGFERPGLGVRCEELDYFNDKRVIFRAVKVTHPDAKGRGLTDELIKEVVSIDEEEDRGGV